MPLIEQFSNWVSLDPVHHYKQLADTFYSNPQVWKKRQPHSYFAQCNWYNFPYCCDVPWYRDLNSSDIIGTVQAELYKLAQPIFSHANAALGNDFVLWGAELNSIPPGVAVTTHCDRHYYADYTTRVHAVLQTNPSAQFEFSTGSHHFTEGECFIFNNKLPHAVGNTGSSDRLHLVMDFVPVDVFPYVERSLGPFGGHKETQHILARLDSDSNLYPQYIKVLDGQPYPFRTQEFLGKNKI